MGHLQLILMRIVLVLVVMSILVSVILLIYLCVNVPPVRCFVCFALSSPLFSLPVTFRSASLRFAWRRPKTPRVPSPKKLTSRAKKTIRSSLPRQPSDNQNNPSKKNKKNTQPPFRRENFKEALTFVVVVLVASIPIAIEIVCTATLALGSRQLSAEGAIVTRLGSIEEMAGMNMLCSVSLESLGFVSAAAAAVCSSSRAQQQRAKKSAPARPPETPPFPREKSSRDTPSTLPLSPSTHLPQRRQ